MSSRRRKLISLDDERLVQVDEAAVRPFGGQRGRRQQPEQKRSDEPEYANHGEFSGVALL